MGFYVLLICSILTLHNISANILTEPKDESYLEIIRKADEAEGINDRLNAGQVSVKPTVISESVKGAVKNVEQDLNNLAVHDVNDVRAPPPLFNQGQAKTLKDDHAYFPPEELKNQIEVKPDCVLPYVVGPCRASKPRFYFNVRSGKCERFIYGGCQGNGNNYMTKEECEVNCVKSAVNSSNV